MPDPQGSPHADSGESLPGLIGRLGEDIATLVDSKLSLLKVEIKEDVAAYARGSVALAAAGIVAAVGFLLVNVAVALLFSEFLDRAELGPPVKYSLGFLILGVVYFLVGLVLATRATRRLTSIDPTPEESVADLEQDKQWLGQSHASKETAGTAGRFRR